MLRKITNEEFINRAKEVHGDVYDYSKVEYIKMHEKVCIICPIHGEFWQTPHNHLKGQKCPVCANISRGNTFRDNKNNFIRRAKEIHWNKYDYSKVIYIHSKKTVCIICKKHGEFFITPNNFLRGHSCPICKQSMLENEVEKYLTENSINFERQRMFNWLGFKRLDFYLPDYNLCIECQGGQHFRNVEWFGGTEGFLYRKKCDKDKKLLCEKHNIKVLYFSHEKYKTFLGEKIIKSTDELMNKIKEDRKKEYKPDTEEDEE